MEQRKFLWRLLCLLIFDMFLPAENLSTSGRFYEKVQEDGTDENGSISETNEVFLKCNTDAPCNYVGKTEKSLPMERLNVFNKAWSYYALWKKLNEKVFNDCKQAQTLGMKYDGIIKIRLPDSSVIDAYCDMETDGGGWIVFQRRIDDTVNFQRNWQSYKNGFGNLLGNFWLGLGVLHQLTSAGSIEIRIDMVRADGAIGFADYDNFTISSEQDKYTLKLGQYSGNVGDALDDSRNTKFSTYDNDNDNAGWNCAESWEGGWWHNSCFSANLNNRFYKAGVEQTAKSMSWNTWTGSQFGSIKFSEMKLRLKNILPSSYFE